MLLYREGFVVRKIYLVAVVLELCALFLYNGGNAGYWLGWGVLLSGVQWILVIRNTVLNLFSAITVFPTPNFLHDGWWCSLFWESKSPILGFRAPKKRGLRKLWKFENLKKKILKSGIKIIFEDLLIFLILSTKSGVFYCKTSFDLK